MNLLDAWFKMNVGDGAFYAVFGLVFVIVGITLLVFILMLIGLIMKRITAKKTVKEEPIPSFPKVEAEEKDELTEETVAAITAALMAYYETQNVKCDFVVRRIKRVS